MKVQSIRSRHWLLRYIGQWFLYILCRSISLCSYPEGWIFDPPLCFPSQVLPSISVCSPTQNGSFIDHSPFELRTNYRKGVNACFGFQWVIRQCQTLWKLFFAKQKRVASMRYNTEIPCLNYNATALQHIDVYRVENALLLGEDTCPVDLVYRAK